jgi:hypothetical protein
VKPMRNPSAHWLAIIAAMILSARIEHAPGRTLLTASRGRD